MRLYISSVAIVVSIIWTILILRFSNRLRLIKKNFRNESIFSSYGIISSFWMLSLGLIMYLYGEVDKNPTLSYLFLICAMCILGALDDIFGSREARGFKGHFRKLIKEGKLTTGALKAIGGGIVGITIGWSISDGNMIKWIMSAVLIPLSANTFNLLDLRPGRCAGVFVMFFCAIYLLNGFELLDTALVLMIIVVTLLFWIPDSKGIIMMGDSGSNVLGAMIGLYSALSTGFVFQITLILIMITTNLYSEKKSISDMIEGNKILKRIDRCLGVR